MDRLIYHNDRTLDVGEARIGPTTAGVLYGWGVFTNIRVYDGKPFAFDRHWERLTRHAGKARVPIPVEAARAGAALAELIAANSVSQGRARITVLKGDTTAWRVEQPDEVKIKNEGSFLIFTSSEPARPRHDLAITLSPYRLLSSGPLAGVKRTAMLENLLAYEEARSRGFAEAVMLNERGEIVSATAGNIFWVQDDELFTPSLGTGCVAGVTRGLVYDIARKVNIHLVEGGFPVQRLLDASEVFLTSTSREIASASNFDIKEYKQRHARITRNIAREFQKLVRDARISL